MSVRRVSATLFLLVLTAAALGQTPSPEDYIRRIEGPQVPNRFGHDPLSIPQMMERYRVPAVSVAVIRDFDVHWARAWGIADVEMGTPATPDTMFQAASISKPVTAMAAMRAVQEGRMPLDGDINSVLKSWKLPVEGFTDAGPVTPRSLMSHTSGTGDAFGFPGYHPSLPLPTVPQILDGQKPSNVGSVRLERPPLTGMRYSGGAFTIMQLALTDLYGQPFPAILEEKVLGPLGMRNSTFEQPLSAARDRQAARAHDRSGKAMDARWHVYPEMAAAGLWTTPTDLARLVIDVQRSAFGKANKVLNPVHAREMLNPVGVGDYAVGFSIQKLGQGWYFAHGGSNWGFRCGLIGHKAKGYGVVIMTNGDGGDTLVQEIRDRVASAYGWDSLDKPILR